MEKLEVVKRDLWETLDLLPQDRINTIELIFDLVERLKLKIVSLSIFLEPQFVVDVILNVDGKLINGYIKTYNQNKILHVHTINI